MALPQIGDRVAHYQLTALIARGGMSTVYRAHDERLGRDVALKLLSPELSEDADFRARFEREWRTAAALRQPNILPIFDAGDWQGQLYIAMLLVEGPDLAAVIDRDGPLAPERAVSIISQVAAALDAAHAQGIVHRDVKPGNILLVQGGGPGGTDHAYLADFGLTRRSSSNSRMTRSGVFLGTVAYIAPEQLQGRAVDGRTDEYSMACVAYQMLTAEPPFPRDMDLGMLSAHLNDPPPMVSARRPDLPRALDGVIAMGMAKSPDARFPSAGAFASAFAAGMRGQSTVVATAPFWNALTVEAPISPVSPAVLAPPRSRTPLVALVAVVLVVIAIAGAFVLGLGTHPSASPTARGVAAGATPTPSGTPGPSRTQATTNLTELPTPTGTAAPTAMPTPTFTPVLVTPSPTSALPTDSAQPVSGKVNLTGHLATEPPGTLVASGAEVTSALEPVSRPNEYFGIQLEPGEVLKVAASADCCGLNVQIATPAGLAQSDIQWSYFKDDARSDEGATWTAIDAGVYSIVVYDGDSAGSAVLPYAVSFTVSPP